MKLCVFGIRLVELPCLKRYGVKFFFFVNFPFALFRVTNQFWTSTLITAQLPDVRHDIDDCKLRLTITEDRPIVEFNLHYGVAD